MKNIFSILISIIIAATFISAVRQPNYNTIEVQDKLEQSVQRGAEIYNEFCMRCHMPEGKGVAKNFPPLAGSDWLTKKRTESIHSVKYGLKGTIVVNGVTYQKMMPNPGLEDEEIADVMNYIMNSWGNKQEKMVTPEEVTSIVK